ncbi:gliding motility protein [Streptomyces sp. NPDC056231]|uniref:gliding motility protein n=1 Tax=Streptomyces sp. NPDC056231 TaxID=3345755 RepID=UPI003AAF5ADE
MGVFSWFRRSSSGAVEPSAEEAAAPTGEASEVAASVDASVTSTGSESSEGVEIPKQQSVDEAADNAAGDNART